MVWACIPAVAKNLMVNAAAIASEYQCLLPQAMTPEHTQDYEGFIHLDEMQGTVTEATSNTFSGITTWKSSIRRKN